MEEPSLVYQEGTAIPSWPIAACLLCCEARENILEANGQTSVIGEGTALQGKGFRSDLEWWACFLPSWNGVGMMSGVVSTGVAGAITSDASGPWECGQQGSGSS